MTGSKRRLRGVSRFVWDHEITKQALRSWCDTIAPHWALDDLLTQDWEPHLQVLREQGLMQDLQDDLEPLVFLDRQNPQAPRWLPGSQDLSPSERLNWFDELLKRYYPTSKEWPPTDDASTRTRYVLESLYLMYHDMLTGMLPERCSGIDDQNL
jgi:hypothetical protein